MSERPRPLFLIGNKRSGTSLMVSLLNQHPRVLITHEADVVWLLFQLYHDQTPPFATYDYDEGKGMRATLEAHGELFQPEGDGEHGKQRIVRRFHAFYERVNQQGRLDWDPPARKDSLDWVGDKKPVQQADPFVHGFVRECFSKARYLHIVRDPRYVVASKRKAARNWDSESVPPDWRGSPRTVMESWARNEEWALRIQNDVPDSFMTVRLEDLAATPAETLAAVFDFLNLDMTPDFRDLAREWVWSDPNTRHQPVENVLSKRVHRIRNRLGYGWTAHGEGNG